MVYRIHFTAQDLARTRVADAPMPLLELQLAARALQDGGRSARLEAWRRRGIAQLSGPGRMALALIPAVGWSPTFLSPALTGSPEEIMEQVRGTSPGRIDRELAEIAGYQPVPAWARSLVDDKDVRVRLFDGLDDLYRGLLAPYWERIAGHHTADRTLRMRQFLTGGVEQVLAQANPRWIRWQTPVLEVMMINGPDQELRLEGSGVLLVPSAFASRSIIDGDATPQPIVIYPAGDSGALRHLTTLVPVQAARAPAGAVSALLGQTRAATLTAIAEHPGCSTKELAALTGISPASASEHATVLREARLIQTLRHRNTALHSPTPLGISLLDTPRPAESPSPVAVRGPHRSAGNR